LQLDLELPVPMLLSVLVLSVPLALHPPLWQLAAAQQLLLSDGASGRLRMHNPPAPR
jgi:hypothetical protein